jgi:phosphate uptake regulator
LATFNQQDGEVRKIQFSGKSSYMLALPKKWVEEMKLQPGDQIMVLRKGTASLIITPRGGAIPEELREAVIEATQNESSGALVRKMVSIYFMGYNIIHLKSKTGGLTSHQREIIKEAVRRHLVGTEIIADSIEGTTLQVLLSYPELSVENTLRRMFLLAASMHRDSMLSLRKLEVDSANAVIKSDDEVDRFSIYVIRQLNMAVQSERILREIGLTSIRDCLGYRLIVKSVERVADHASGIAEKVLNIEEPLDENTLTKIIQLSEFSLNHFEKSGQALFRQDYNAADKIVEKAELISEMQNDLLASIEVDKTISSYHPIRLITEDIRRTMEYASDIAEIVLNMTASPIVK